MERIVATVIGMGLSLAFMGFMAASAESIPLWIITLCGLAMMAYGLIKDLREGLSRAEEANEQ